MLLSDLLSKVPAADLVEWDWNMVVSTPASVSKEQIQRDKVFAVTTLWGFLNDTNKEERSSALSRETCNEIFISTEYNDQKLHYCIYNLTIVHLLYYDSRLVLDW